MPKIHKATKLLSFTVQREGNDYYFKLINKKSCICQHLIMRFEPAQAFIFNHALYCNTFVCILALTFSLSFVRQILFVGCGFSPQQIVI